MDNLGWTDICLYVTGLTLHSLLTNDICYYSVNLDLLIEPLSRWLALYAHLRGSCKIGKPSENSETSQSTGDKVFSGV
jgi:hypothetical protein